MRRTSPRTHWLSYLCGLVGAALLVLTLLPTAAPAQTGAMVTSLADSGPGSLRDALAVALPGATITFTPGLAGTIPLNSPLVIEQSMTIQGPGAATIRL